LQTPRAGPALWRVLSGPQPFTVREVVTEFAVLADRRSGLPTPRIPSGPWYFTGMPDRRRALVCPYRQSVTLGVDLRSALPLRANISHSSCSCPTTRIQQAADRLCEQQTSPLQPAQKQLEPSCRSRSANPKLRRGPRIICQDSKMSFPTPLISRTGTAALMFKARPSLCAT
jgi:hypothetical protein